MMLTQARLRKLTRRWVPYWRDRLGLRDWFIDVKYWTLHDAEDKLGEVHSDFADRRADMRLLNAETPDAREVWKRNGNDPELVIVHELLHVVFRALGVGGGTYIRSRFNKTVLAEQVINTLAKCLVDRRRGRA
jgi:hypothetical protein